MKSVDDESCQVIFEVVLFFSPSRFLSLKKGKKSRRCSRLDGGYPRRNVLNSSKCVCLGSKSLVSLAELPLFADTTLW